MKSVWKASNTVLADFWFLTTTTVCHYYSLLQTNFCCLIQLCQSLFFNEWIPTFVFHFGWFGLGFLSNINVQLIIHIKCVVVYHWRDKISQNYKNIKICLCHSLIFWYNLALIFKTHRSLSHIWCIYSPLLPGSGFAVLRAKSRIFCVLHAIFLRQDRTV